MIENNLSALCQLWLLGAEQEAIDTCLVFLSLKCSFKCSVATSEAELFSGQNEQVLGGGAKTHRESSRGGSETSGWGELACRFRLHRLPFSQQEKECGSSLPHGEGCTLLLRKRVPETSLGSRLNCFIGALGHQGMLMQAGRHSLHSALLK